MADILNRTGGPFLDQIELEARENKSARLEGREPNYAIDNLAPLGVGNIPKLVLEVDITSADAIDEAITRLVQAKTDLEPHSEPSSLHPETVDPTIPDPSVEKELELGGLDFGATGGE